MTRITISVSGDFDLAVDEVWPDGDAPEVITAEAVAELMREQGVKSRVLSDWCLINDLQVSVYADAPNPKADQDAVLFGDPPPKRLRSQVDEVWT